MNTIIAYQPSFSGSLFKGIEEWTALHASMWRYYNGLNDIDYLYTRRTPAAIWRIKLKEPN